MNRHIESLFGLTRSQVSEQHINDFSPSDPGYDSYVRLWTRIYRSGEIPKQTEFDLSEVIGLTGWAKPADFNDPVRFRQYRRFTSAVGAALIENGNDDECVRVGNYLARDLIVDTDIDNAEHFESVRNVFPVLRDTLFKTNHDEQYPYFTFGSLILAQMAGDFVESETMAAQLIEDDAAVRNNDSINWITEDSRFLFGLTNYDQLHSDWFTWGLGLKNPNGDSNLALVIDAISECAT